MIVVQRVAQIAAVLQAFGRLPPLSSLAWAAEVWAIVAPSINFETAVDWVGPANMGCAPSAQTLADKGVKKKFTPTIYATGVWRDNPAAVDTLQRLLGGVKVEILSQVCCQGKNTWICILLQLFQYLYMYYLVSLRSVVVLVCPSAQAVLRGCREMVGGRERVVSRTTS